MSDQDEHLSADRYQFVIHGPDHESIFPIPEGSSIIGRQSGVDLKLTDQLVSRRHAQIDCLAGKEGLVCQLTDLGSSNGTIIDGDKVEPNLPVVLRPGSEIKIGGFSLILEVTVMERPPKKIPQETPKHREVERVSLKPKVTAGEPPQPPPPILEPTPGPEPIHPQVPPGLSLRSERLMGYLPGIYHNDFMARFLGIFEAILSPLEWNISHFDLFLDPGTAPEGFLPWLENWFSLPSGPAWSLDQRRQFLREAHILYARRGTRWALSRLLEIYLGHKPEIIDTGNDLEPHTFRVEIPLRRRAVNPELIEVIIDANKPAHTTYSLKFRN